MKAENEETCFERCPHDDSNKYAMISNELIRDATISIECRWLLIYCLSHSKRYKIRFKFIMQNQGIGKDRFYKILNEAIKSGYVKRLSYLTEKNLKRYKYIYSESPRFKANSKYKEEIENNSLCPENQDTEIQDPENKDCLRRLKKRRLSLSIKENKKKNPPPPKRGSDSLSSLKNNGSENEAKELVEYIQVKVKQVNVHTIPLTSSQFSKDKKEAQRLLERLTPRNDSDESPPLTEALTLAKRVVDATIEDEFWRDKITSANYLKLKWSKLSPLLQKKTSSQKRNRPECKLDDDWQPPSDEQLEKEGRLVYA